MTKKYAVTGRPGYFGSNETHVISAHSTLALAIRARGKGYLDERGDRKMPCCVICSEGGWEKDERIFWGNMFPEVVA